MDKITRLFRQPEEEGLDYDLPHIIREIEAADMDNDAAFHDMMRALYEGESGESLMDRLGIAISFRLSNSTMERYVQGLSAPRYLKRKQDMRDAIVAALKRADADLRSAGH